MLKYDNKLYNFTNFALERGWYDMLKEHETDPKDRWFFSISKGNFF